MQPTVSILIAARNEEANILRCLQALERLAFPAEDLEVLIGNDRSEDNTGPLVAAFIAEKSNFRLLDINSRIGNQAGKANVLAQLAREARGRFFLITDADCEVSAGWISGMIRPFSNEGVGVVTGCTRMVAHTAFQKLQAIDWLAGQHVIDQLARFGIPLTTMGNNMAVRRQAYEATGGYEHLPFSIVEDFQLFREILKHRYNFAHLFRPEVLAMTQPLPGFRAWLHQRKRWMIGAMELPWYFLAFLLLQTLFYPLLIGLSFWFPVLAVSIWGLKFGLQSFQLAVILKRFHCRDLLPFIPLYDPYVHIGYLMTLIFYLLPTKVIWKGRTYP
ncbi:glycosyltransferase [Larkinella soli]|uniref:glycosyltransferase n=1 Tax=Larkinella soli TaxID=1770527 RepID=UPI000FFCB29A|nr:glycosyltransferase [Larkinella soli]